jgi:hypothetical protein
MTTYYQGYEGTVKFVSTGNVPVSVTAVTAWSIDITKQILERTAQGDTAQKNVGGLVSAQGSIDLLYDGNNNALIEAINTSADSGTALFELYLIQASNKKIVFNGIISGASYGASRDDVITISCSFVSTGTITLEI